MGDGTQTNQFLSLLQALNYVTYNISLLISEWLLLILVFSVQKSNSLSVSCHVCNRWCHLRCGTGISRDQYMRLTNGNEAFNWTCNLCAVMLPEQQPEPHPVPVWIPPPPPPGFVERPVTPPPGFAANADDRPPTPPRRTPTPVPMDLGDFPMNVAQSRPPTPPTPIPRWCPSPPLRQ